MQRIARSLAVVVLAGALVATLTAASCRRRTEPEAKPPAPGPSAEATGVVVGTPAGAEGHLLGEMVVQLLRARGIEATGPESYASVDQAAAAVRSGSVDLLVAHSSFGSAVATAPAHSGDAVCTSKDVADQLQLSSLEDVANYVRAGSDLVLAYPDRYATSVKALQEAYGFTLDSDRLEAVSEGAAVSALDRLRMGAVQLAFTYETDPRIDDLGLVVLGDPRAFAAADSPTVAAFNGVTDRYPQVTDALAPAFAGLTTEALRALNRRVVFGGEDAGSVAADYLSSGGYLK